MSQLFNVFKKSKKKDYSSPEDDKALQKSLKKRHVYNNKKTTVDYYLEEPLQENYVLLLGLGHGVRGNLFYILDELNHNDRYAHLEIYVRTFESTDADVQKFIAERGWTRTKTVYDGNTFGYLAEVSKYLLTEVHFPMSWTKKEGQVVINVWHGTPLKKLGLTMHTDEVHHEGITQKNFIAADYLLYPNEYTRDHMLESFRVRNLLQGKALMLGYPRTTGLLDSRNRQELLQKLAPQGEKLIAYMPTWRDHLEDSAAVEDVRQFLDAMDEVLAEDEILYVNIHHKIDASLDYSSYRHIRVFPPDMDSYQLLSVTDSLITDYSSVFFDYLASGKNIVLYCPDLEIYEKERGMYMNIRELPFHIVETPQAVIDAVRAGKTYDDEEVRARFCDYDSEENAKKLCQLFVGDETGLDLIPFETDSRSRLLLHCENMAKEVATEYVKELYRSIDPEVSDAYVSCDTADVDDHIDGAYPFLYECRAIGVNSPIRYTKDAKNQMISYVERSIPLRTLAEETAPVLRANFLRYYGTDRFNKIVVVDTDDAERILMFRAMGKELVTIVHQRMLDAMTNGDRMLRETLALLLDDGQKVYALDDASKQELDQLLPQNKKGCVETAPPAKTLAEHL